MKHICLNIYIEKVRKVSATGYVYEDYRIVNKELEK
jgi:hypothetical protein